ncbi:16S rRNA (guanine(527)-N(7))-methyltransferase RsmG [Cardinium endosymbiont of Culicoides punctatus]|uniref:16S rRNA (guanine(527)-N(7))-methyltransferase RsmG n=1 Tax=Cardinium endosymbiont of Culicoides punctatus TaxID=2304601 RepID=UPI0010584AFC|nr:16S rRNA (guanine(527)-N(7))-methyltransferase RsmG [Cardinium endosymbiont of Culicoides punctatus]TDG95586.1 Ribosomal RNA small subunit methyltransferase G [Cardinium endosymbiont of Culicoides punctatus]
MHTSLEKPCDSAAIVCSHFKELSNTQIAHFSSLGNIYRLWNTKINLISRKDIDNLYMNHILHSLSISKIISFCPNTHILDFGTGGGFPGIPLAIMFPEVHFHLVDSIGKKIKAVHEIVTTLGLNNITVSCIRGEEIQGKYDFVVGRGVTNLERFYGWVKDKIAQEQKNSLHNGILYLKGYANVALPFSTHVYPLQDFFKETFFKEKCLVHGYEKTMVSD